MAQWGKLLEENLDKVVEALETSAKEMRGGNKGSVYRAELNDDGSVTSYWTQEGAPSVGAQRGTARVLYDFRPSGDDEEDYLWATEDFYPTSEMEDLIKKWKLEDKNA